jgi:hypothetical protein
MKLVFTFLKGNSYSCTQHVCFCVFAVLNERAL